MLLPKEAMHACGNYFTPIEQFKNSCTAMYTGCYSNILHIYRKLNSARVVNKISYPGGSFDIIRGYYATVARFTYHSVTIICVANISCSITNNKPSG